jgi:hypothetical protein
MKFSMFCKTSAVAALLTVAASAGSAWSAANCYDLLVGEKYRCKYKYETGFQNLNSCAYFSSYDSTRQKVLLVWTSVTYECTCSAKGSYANPQYNQGKEFLCSSLNAGFDDAFTGKVVGKKIKGLYNSYGNIASAVVECEIDPTCP